MKNEKTRTPDEICDEIDRTLDKIDDCLMQAAKLCFEADNLRRELPEGAQKEKYLDILAKAARRIDAATLAVSGYSIVGVSLR